MFKPGVSGNPSGAPKMPEELRGIRLLSKRELGALIAKYARMTHSAILAAIDRSDIPALEAAIAQQVVKAASGGNAKAFQFLLDYAGCRPDTGVSIGQNDATLALDSMTTSELLDVVRASLPAAASLPNIQSPGVKDE